MKLLLDEDIHPKVATISRSLGIDVVSVHELGRCGLSDEEQLVYAAAENRILVTRNRDDFIQLTVAFFKTGDPHCGLLIIPYSVPNKDPERMAHALLQWCERHCTTKEPFAYLIDFLSSS